MSVKCTLLVLVCTQLFYLFFTIDIIYYALTCSVHRTVVSNHNLLEVSHYIRLPSNSCRRAVLVGILLFSDNIHLSNWTPGNTHKYCLQNEQSDTPRLLLYRRSTTAPYKIQCFFLMVNALRL